VHISVSGFLLRFVFDVDIVLGHRTACMWAVFSTLFVVSIFVDEVCRISVRVYMGLSLTDPRG
jgi:hypothetical protein